MQVRPALLIVVATAVLLMFPVVAWLLSRDANGAVAWDRAVPGADRTVYSARLCTENEHLLESHGMEGDAQNVADPAKKKPAPALPGHALSCYASTESGQSGEGHAPIIARLLLEAPDVKWIDQPGTLLKIQSP